MKETENYLEEKILACAINNKHKMMELITTVSADYFSNNSKWLFEIICKHFSNPSYKEIPTWTIVQEYLSKNIMNVPNMDKFESYYVGVKNTKYVEEEFTWYIEKLKQNYNSTIHKKCISEIQSTLDTLNNGSVDKIKKVNDIIKKSVVAIDSIYKQKAYKEGTLKESAKERALTYKNICENPESAQGILTKFATFDKITNGLKAGELMIIAGSSGTGKSILMHNIAVNAYLGNNNPLITIPENADDSGKNILYFSLEMPKESQERRIDACMSGLYHTHIRDGLLSEEDKQKYLRTLKFQSKYKKEFHIVDLPKGATTREIELKFVEIESSKFKPDLVVVDYLGIMKPNNEADDADWLALGRISAELHEFARIYSTSVITGSQVNRPKDVTKVDYSTNRIARSDMIPTNANIILQIGNREDEDVRTDMPVYIIKMRDGERGSFVLMKNFAKMRVYDMTEESFTMDEDSSSNDEI